MPIGQAFAMAFLASALLATWRSERGWPYLVAGLGILGSTMVVLIREGLQPVLVAGLYSSAFVLSSTVIGSALWADLVGLPRSLSQRTGIGIRRQAWDPRLRRRRGASWLTVLGISVLIVGISQASGYYAAAMRSIDPGAWVAIGEPVVGAGALTGAVYLATRRDRDLTVEIYAASVSVP